MNEHDAQLNSPHRSTGAATACPQSGSTPTSPGPEGYRPLDTHDALTGRDLRYVLTYYIECGFNTVAQLVRKLGIDGYTVWGRASKVVSDALRWEISNGRVRRLRRGVYAIRKIPRTTEYRIRTRAQALRRAPHVVATRRNMPPARTLRGAPSPDRFWQEWRKTKAQPARAVPIQR